MRTIFKIFPILRILIISILFLLLTSVLPCDFATDSSVFAQESAGTSAAETASDAASVSWKDGVLTLPGIGTLSIPAKNVTVQEDAESGKTLVFSEIPSEETSDVQVVWTVNVRKSEPWVRLKCVLVSKTDCVLQKKAFPSIQIAPSFEPSALKILGTAGLRNPGEDAGSYMFLAAADPETRNGLVCGWLTAEIGSGIVQNSVSDGTLTFHAFEEFGKLRMKAGQKYASDEFLVGHFQDVRLGLEAYANAVSNHCNIHMKPAPSGYCTWYSNKNGGAGNEASTAEFAQFAAEKLIPFGMNLFQIDDKWQLGASRNGPNKNFMSHNPDGPYPSGMKPTTSTLNASGLTSGLWFMPFSGNYNDPYYADKQSWFVKSAITYPAPGEKNTRHYSSVNQIAGDPYETFWGGTSLDFTNPVVRAYVQKEVGQIAKDWGYKYFKIDGTWTAMACEQLYVNDEYAPDDLGEQVFVDPTLTNIQVYRDAWKLVRDSAGDDVFIMSCNLSQNMRTLGSSYGLVDAMRIGPDNGSSWRGICAGPIRGTARYFLNGRIWWNDPDPVYVRDSIPLTRAQLSTSWCSLAGQLYAFSDWLPELSEERIDVLRRTMQNHRRLNVRPVDLFNSELANVWILTENEKTSENGTVVSPRRDVVGLFNWNEKDVTEINYPLEFVGLDPSKRYVAYDFWNKVFLPVIEGRLKVELPPGECKILSLRAIEPHPLLVSTNRHISSPIFEVSDESWSEKTQTLTGTSTVVLNDPYELDIFVPESEKLQSEGKVLKVTDVNLENLRKDSDVKITQWDAQLNGARVRVRFTVEGAAPTVSAIQHLGEERTNLHKFTRDIRWTIHFEAANEEAAGVSDAAFPPKFQLSSELRRKSVLLKWDAFDGFGMVLVRRDLSDSNEQNVVRKISGTSFEDFQIKGGKSYEYTIQSIQFDGKPGKDARQIVVKTPKTPILGPLPPEPESNLADLTPVSTSSGWGGFSRNRAVSGNPLTLNGKTYDKGFGLHAAGHAAFAIPEGSKRFVAVCGLDDFHKTDDRRSVILRIYTDVKEMGEPRVLAAESPVLCCDTLAVWHFDVPLSDREKELYIEIDDAGDGIACDHVDFVRAGFLK